MKYNFTEEQSLAIYKIAYMMANADGVIHPDEVLCIADEMKKISSFDEALFNAKTEFIPALSALNTIASFGQGEKKFVSAFLGYILSVDGDIGDEELALWRIICDLCGLPKMSNRQAINFLQTV